MRSAHGVPPSTAAPASPGRHRSGSGRRHRRPADAYQLVFDDMCDAVVQLFQQVDDLRAFGWPYADFEQRSDDAVRQAGAMLARRPDPTMRDLVQALEPVLAAWWPHNLPMTQDIHAVVERLRRAVAAARYAVPAEQTGLGRQPTRHHAA